MREGEGKHHVLEEIYLGQSPALTGYLDVSILNGSPNPLGCSGVSVLPLGHTTADIIILHFRIRNRMNVKSTKMLEKEPRYLRSMSFM